MRHALRTVRKSLGPPDAADVTVCLQQRILHHVLGVLGVTANEQAEPERGRLSPHEQPLHGRRASRRRGSYERLVLIAAVPASRGMQISGIGHASSVTFSAELHL
jgi:hypothetical protein